MIWQLRFSSSNSIAVLKDTIKEDEENKIKQNWEFEEPGRSKLSNVSRIKYLLDLKKEKGEGLETNEEKLLVEKRERRINRNNMVSKLLDKNFSTTKQEIKPIKPVSINFITHKKYLYIFVRTLLLKSKLIMLLFKIIMIFFLKRCQILILIKNQ